MHRGVVELDATEDAGNYRRAEHFLETAAQMGVGVAHHQVHPGYLRVPAANHPADKGDEILLGTTVGHLDMAFLAARLGSDKDAEGAGALVLVVLAQQHAGRCEQRTTRIVQQLSA